ncbi:MAG: hypothetical protein RMX96_14805 [Nostoc sp. ChiSLP02]|nr:hypothetical protein [Nostoc sp. ChiSLP02]
MSVYLAILLREVPILATPGEDNNHGMGFTNRLLVAKLIRTSVLDKSDQF